MNETDLRDENWNGEWVLDLHTVQHISSDLACATSEARKPLLSRDPVLLENLRVTSRRHEWIELVSSWVWSPPGFGLLLGLVSSWVWGLLLGLVSSWMVYADRILIPSFRTCGMERFCATLVLLFIFGTWFFTIYVAISLNACSIV
jgi:hypothetical protein